MYFVVFIYSRYSIQIQAYGDIGQRVTCGSDIKIGNSKTSILQVSGANECGLIYLHGTCCNINFTSAPCS